MKTTRLAILSFVLAGGTAAYADTFGTGTSQFTLDFVTISGSTNPTPAQTTVVNFDGFGIVEYDYRIGVHEITNSQWNKFVASLGVPVTGSPSGAYDRSFYNSGTGTTDVPTNGVSWYETAQFVNWLNTSTGRQAAYKFTGTQGQSDYTFTTWDSSEAWGGTNLYRHKDAYYFLPDEDEWFKAAYWNGIEIQDYATRPGDTLHQGDGTSGTGWNYHDPNGGQSSEILGIIYYGYATDPRGPWNVGSGSQELGGTYDMMGNVWEWMESPYSDPSYGTGSRRGMRGGSWKNRSYLDAAPRGLGGFPPPDEVSGIGFRVASIPEPTTCTLALAALCFAMSRRRRGPFMNYAFT